MPVSTHSDAADSPEGDLYVDYVNERYAMSIGIAALYSPCLACSHMQAFAHALSAEYFVDNEYYDTPPSHSPSTTRSFNNLQAHSPRALRSPSTLQVNGNASVAKRIRRISALSDFAPVNLRVRKRKKGAIKGHEKKQDWTFVLVRWPLLVSSMFVYIHCNKSSTPRT